MTREGHKKHIYEFDFDVHNILVIPHSQSQTGACTFDEFTCRFVCRCLSCDSTYSSDIQPVTLVTMLIHSQRYLVTASSEFIICKNLYPLHIPARNINLYYEQVEIKAKV